MTAGGRCGGGRCAAAAEGILHRSGDQDLVFGAAEDGEAAYGGSGGAGAAAAERRGSALGDDSDNIAGGSSNCILDFDAEQVYLKLQVINVKNIPGG